MKLFVFTLLLAGSIAMHVERNNPGRDHRADNLETSTLAHSISFTDPTTSDPCYSCRNDPIAITDTWAGQCFPDGVGGSCSCICADLFCFNGEFIDRSTCVPNGRLQDCRCISTSTVVPTTVTPTSVPFTGCGGSIG
ncbi:uncharacterized protein LOC119082728 [Bradysia coprophila]|uniref:uncharacterized protein LOC119082728 n=1 Tax=Bradysia coprophila TaxID=38358 RepID=UPI00187D9C02|nr:uncharacterized protein LOC119082728 [Bradysia coprophila]